MLEGSWSIRYSRDQDPDVHKQDQMGNGNRSKKVGFEANKWWNCGVGVGVTKAEEGKAKVGDRMIGSQ
jgi:hypothetical protein